MGVLTLVWPNGALNTLVMLYGVVAVVIGIADIIFYVKMEQYMAFGPTVALITGILGVMAGIMLVVYPSSGTMALTVLFPIWFIAHCISRLSHLNIVRFTAGSFYYYFSMILNIIGLVLGVLMLIRPQLSFVSVSLIIGLYLILLGIDKIVQVFSQIGSNY
ncbi:MAG: DUF308 domain-containing protein [Oscillospiraceae bacterium]|nr:DUF308 domain-containing protein [Oscillospiraceae bacterium]